MSFTDVISRPDAPAPLVPQPVITQVVQELPTASAVLANARTVPMASHTTRMPALSVLPQAYFVAGDAGLKQTTNQDWQNVFLTAEEIAAIVPIPQAYLDDADIPVWDEVRPRMVEAIGSVIDAAALFGVNRPATWSTDIFTQATTAPLAAVEMSTDPGTAVANAGMELARNGYQLNGFVTAPGFVWQLVGFRSSQGTPIYQPDPAAPVGVGRLYGFPLQEVRSDAWNMADAAIIAGDWTKAIVGLRQDATFTVHTEGVISDNDGKVVYNLMQQDSVALRVVMRIAFATAAPVTRLTRGKAAGSYSPFVVLAPAAA